MKTEHKTRPSFRKTPLLAGLVLACGLFTGNSSAQWIVNDPAVIAQDWAKFLKEFEHWRRQIQEYQDALTRITSVMNNPSGLMSSYQSDMKEVADDHGDDINCKNPSGGSGLSISELFNAVAPSLSDNVPKKQYNLCIQANHLRNMKYNEMVRIIKQTKKQSEKLDELIREAKSSNTEGNWRSAMLNGQILIASTLVDMQYSQTRMAAYDQMIERVELDSVSLGRKAMDGKQTLMSAAISTVTLKTALEAIE